MSQNTTCESFSKLYSNLKFKPLYLWWPDGWELIGIDTLESSSTCPSNGQFEGIISKALAIGGVIIFYWLLNLIVCWVLRCVLAWVLDKILCLLLHWLLGWLLCWLLIDCSDGSLVCWLVGTAEGLLLGFSLGPFHWLNNWLCMILSYLLSNSLTTSRPTWQCDGDFHQDSDNVIDGYTAMAELWRAGYLFDVIF